MLNQVSDGAELDVLLSKGRKILSFQHLARLKLALKFEDKLVSLVIMFVCDSIDEYIFIYAQFTKHPLCQQTIQANFYESGYVFNSHWSIQCLVIMWILTLYPFLVLAYILFPKTKVCIILFEWWRERKKLSTKI